MCWIYVKNAIFIYIWISLFKSGILLSNSLRSKKIERIFFLRDVQYEPPNLVHKFKSNLFFAHSYNKYLEDINIINCTKRKGSVCLGLFKKNVENNLGIEDNFPLYESKWQMFWYENKLFKTSEPDSIGNVVEDSETDSLNTSIIKSNLANSNGTATYTPNNDYLHTHSEFFKGNEDDSCNYTEQVCNYASLDSISRYSNQTSTHLHDTMFIDNSVTNTPFKSSKETLNTCESLNVKPKYYILSMIPYPSGKGLHVGHLLGYTAVDVIARYKRLNNFNVLNPIGFDCFGIPTETYSEMVNKTPQQVTCENVENFRSQLKNMGFSFDFSREINTSDVNYYRWTQWIFQNMFLRGLAYLDKGYVNYCPELNSELSNEEIENGKSVRGDYDVYKRLRKMWKLRITDYAKRLYEDLNLVDYPERLINLQKNWIGPKKGYLIKFTVDDMKPGLPENAPEMAKLYLSGFIDDISHCVDIESVEVPVLSESVLDYCSPDRKYEVCGLLNETLKMTSRELSNETNTRKIFSGMSVINPYNGNKLPIYVTNSLINTNKDISCKINLTDASGSDSSTNNVANHSCNYEIGNEELGFQSDNDGGESKNDFKKYEWCRPYLYLNIKDWEFSRNRGWGEPIPVKLNYEHNRNVGECVDQGANEVAHPKEMGPSDNLELRKQFLEDLPLVLNENIKETMPQWAGSSWHYLRFVDPENKHEIFNKKIASYWLPVDLYIGGVEHAVSHLLYSRFWNKFLYDINVSPVAEPFKKIILHGVIKTVSFYVPRSVYDCLPSEIKLEINEYNSNKYPNRNSVCNSNNKNSCNIVDSNNAECVKSAKLDDQPSNEVEVPPKMVMKYKNKYVLRSDKAVQMKIRMKKMSKSRGNVINPEEIIRLYGSDALRLHLLFLGPIERDKVWSIESISGVYKLLKSIHAFYTHCIHDFGYYSPNTNAGCSDHSGLNSNGEAVSYSALDKQVLLELNKFIDNVTNNLEHVKLNKISEFFTFLKLMQNWHRQHKLTSRILDTFLVMLSPFAPHLTEQLWYLRHLKLNSLNGTNNPHVASNSQDLSNKRRLDESGSHEIDSRYKSISSERWPKKINVL